jgi:hypothetical protein
MLRSYRVGPRGDRKYQRNDVLGSWKSLPDTWIGDGYG